MWNKKFVLLLPKGRKCWESKAVLLCVLLADWVWLSVYIQTRGYVQRHDRIQYNNGGVQEPYTAIWGKSVFNQVWVHELTILQIFVESAQSYADLDFAEMYIFMFDVKHCRIYIPNSSSFSHVE